MQEDADVNRVTPLHKWQVGNKANSTHCGWKCFLLLGSVLLAQSREEERWAGGRGAQRRGPSRALSHTLPHTPPPTPPPSGVALKPRFLKQATGLGVVITHQSVDCECRREHEFQNTHSQVVLRTYLFLPDPSKTRKLLGQKCHYDIYERVKKIPGIVQNGHIHPILIGLSLGGGRQDSPLCP